LIFKGYSGYSSELRWGLAPLTLPLQSIVLSFLGEFFDRLKLEGIIDALQFIMFLGMYL
jgi:hypothetical protein